MQRCVEVFDAYSDANYEMAVHQAYQSGIDWSTAPEIKDRQSLVEFWLWWQEKVNEDYLGMCEVAMGEGFTVKDSGERQRFESGMQRDTTKGKINYTLAVDGPMFKRYAEHLTKGAQKYEARNWMKAAGAAEHARFKESAFRHFMQWYLDERDEDHAAAVWFNINGAEYVVERLQARELYNRPGRFIGVCGTCEDVRKSEVSEGSSPGVTLPPALDAPTEKLP